MADVLVERAGPVTTLRLNRPGRRNAIGGTMLREYLEAMEAAAADDAVRVIVTTGAGSTFCVGMDLERAGEIGGRPTAELLNDDVLSGERGVGALSPAQRLLETSGIGRWAERVLAVPKPTVAALNGVAAGGGFALAMLHDFRLVAEGARLTPGFLGVGAAPEMGLTHLLPRIVGWRTARHLLLRNPVLESGEAVELGVADEQVPGPELAERARELAAELARQPGLAQQVTKQLLAESVHNDLAGQLRAEYRAQLMLFGAPQTREHMARLRARLAGEA